MPRSKIATREKALYWAWARVTRARRFEPPLYFRPRATRRWRSGSRVVRALGRPACGLVRVARQRRDPRRRRSRARGSSGGAPPPLPRRRLRLYIEHALRPLYTGALFCVTIAPESRNAPLCHQLKGLPTIVSRAPVQKGLGTIGTVHYTLHVCDRTDVVC